MVSFIGDGRLRYRARTNSIIGSFRRLEEEFKELLLSESLTDFENREVDGEHETYAERPGEEFVNAFLVEYIAHHAVEAMRVPQSFDDSLQISNEQSDRAIKEGLYYDCDNASMPLQMTRERRLVEDKDRLGGEQRSDYRLGKCGYLDGEFRQRQFDEQEQKQESKQEENEHRPHRKELAAQPSADRRDDA
jgi:hypothetical protein